MVTPSVAFGASSFREGGLLAAKMRLYASLAEGAVIPQLSVKSPLLAHEPDFNPNLCPVPLTGGVGDAIMLNVLTINVLII